MSDDKRQPGLRARKRPMGALSHVRSWPLRPTSVRLIEVRFRAGTRVFNAVLGEFLRRSRAVKADPAYAAAREMSPGPARRAAFSEIEARYGFTLSAAQSYGSSLRQSWVREQVPAQEAQVLARQAFEAVARWHYGHGGRPRFKSVRRGVRSMSSKDVRGALRPVLNNAGELSGLQWGRGFVIPIAPPAISGRRGREQQAEYALLNEHIVSGRVLHARIVRTLIKGRPTYRIQVVCDGPPTRRHSVGDGRVSFDLGPSNVSIAVENTNGGWWSETVPLAEDIENLDGLVRRLQRRLDRQHRAGSPTCFNHDGTHRRGCDWTERSLRTKRTQTALAEAHRRLAEYRKSSHGRLANQLLAHGTTVACEKLNYVSWQKNFPHSTRVRAAGLFVEIVRRKAASAGGTGLYEYSPYSTALSQMCLCGNRKKKSLSERTHRCGNCGLTFHRDEFSAYLGLHVRPSEEPASDVLDLEAARVRFAQRTEDGGFWRQDADAVSRPNTSTTNRRGRRRCKRALARVKARQSRSTQTFQAAAPTATLLLDQPVETAA